MDADVFNHFIQTAWFSSSLTSASVASIVAEYTSLGLDPFLLFKEARFRKKWSTITKALATKVPALTGKAAEKQVASLYKRSIEPFEKGWQLLNAKKSSKRALPGLDAVYHGYVRDKVVPVKAGVWATLERVTCRFCWKCQADIELYDEKVLCAECGAPCCRSCFEGDVSDPKLILCNRCSALLTPSWNDLQVCTVCGFNVLPTVRESWIRCCQCGGLVHRVCAGEVEEDEKAWVCGDCRKRETMDPPALCRVYVDPHSHIVTPVYTRN